MSFIKKIDKNNIIVYTVLLMCSVLLPFLIAQSYILGPVTLIGLVGLAMVIAIFMDYKYGIYTLLLYATFIFYIDRLLPVDIPLGVFFDLIIAIMFCAMVIQLKGREPFQWKTNRAVTIVYLAFFIYFLLQLANPNAVSLKAWLIGSRMYVLLLLYYLLVHFFSHKENIKGFFKLWFVLALIVGFYGITQEIFGLTGFETKWLYETPERFKLLFIMGRIRKFSVLSDPSSFGLYMSFCILAVLSFLFAPLKRIFKIGLFGMMVLMLVSMSFAGTRTAFAMLVVGVVFFVILNLRNKKIMIASIVIIVCFLGILFGPFYNAHINRLRTTFQVSEDASMSVRDVKRIRFQSYIQSNPIGGGINTAGNGGLKYSRGHTLAGKFDPDSGYLRTAMEMGPLGLLILIALNCAVLITGISNHFNLKDPMLRSYNLACIVPFMGLTVAHYTQDAFLQKPVNVLVIATYVMVVKLKDLD